MTTNEDFTKKCRVLAALWSKHRNNPQLADLIDHHNIGFPLAFMQEHNLCVATEKGIEEINETFNDLVTIVEDKEEHSDLISKFLSEYFITTGSSTKNVNCDNKSCDNKSASVDVICGKLISSTNEKCGYMNYSVAKQPKRFMSAL